MNDKITKVEKESKIKLPIAEYEQKKKELQKCAATIYNELVSRTGDDHSSEKEWVFSIISVELWHGGTYS